MKNNFYWIFIQNSTMNFLIMSDDELGEGGRRWDLSDEGWELLCDSALSRKQARQYLQDYYPEYSPFEPKKAPVSFREACAFVNGHHRHHVASQGHKFSVALSDGRNIIGMAIVGR